MALLPGSDRGIRTIIDRAVDELYELGAEDRRDALVILNLAVGTELREERADDI